MEQFLKMRHENSIIIRMWISVAIFYFWKSKLVFLGSIRKRRTCSRSGKTNLRQCHLKKSKAEEPSLLYCLPIVEREIYAIPKGITDKSNCCIVTTNHTNTYACEIITTQWRRATQFLEKYTSHFIWKGCVWEGLGDRTELQHIDPHSYGHQRWVSRSPWLLNRRPGGLASLGAGFLYRIFSPTNWLPVFTKLYNSSTPTSSCGRHNCTHSTHPQSRL